MWRVIAGSPLRLFRLSAAGQRVAEAIEQHLELPPRHAKLTDRLVDAGAIHPNPVGSPFTAAKTIARKAAMVGDWRTLTSA